MYDETYGVIYEVIARKFRASLEPFWDLKISKYVEYLMRVSSEYIISWALLSLRSTVGWTSRVFLAYVMPWINKASLALYIARITVTRGWPARDCSSVTNLNFGRNTVLSSSSLWLKHRNLSLSRLRVDLRRHLHDFRGPASIDVYAFYWRLFTTCTIILCSYWGDGQGFI